MITLEQLSNYTALDTAFSIVMKKSNVAGIDGITPMHFAENRKRNLQEISWAIKAGVFQIDPVNRISIKKNDKNREISILTCKDRIVARAFHKAVSKLIEPFLDDTCYAFRGGRSALLAAQKIESTINDGFLYVAKADIQDFFKSINRELLLKRLEPIIENDAVLNILKNFICAPISEHNKMIEDCGISLGSPLSPILSNYYLCGIDNFFGKIEEVKYFRYVDDIVFLGRNEQCIRNSLFQLESLLADVFLTINPAKTVITSIANGFDYLGFRFDNNGITASSEAEDALSDILEETWEEFRLRPKEERINQLKKKLDGWNAYYKNNMAGGLLGVLIYINTGKYADEEIWAYRKSLESDDIEKIRYISDAWKNKGRLDYALNEYGLYFNLPYQAFKDETNRQLIELFNQYFTEISSDILGTIIETYVQLKEYSIGEKLSEKLWESKKEIDQTVFNGLGYDRDEINKFRSVFIQQDDDFNLEVLKDEERHFFRQKKYISDEILKRHLAGEITIDACILNEQMQSSMLVLDIDVAKEFLLRFASEPATISRYEEESHRYGIAVQKTAGDLGLKSYLENTGGFGRHLWLFFNEKMENKNAALIGEKLIELSEEIPEGITVEIFPSGRRVKTLGSVPMIKLPFGINVMTKKKSFFYSADKTLLLNWRSLHENLIINDVKLAQKHCNIITKITKEVPEFDDTSERLGPLTPNVSQIIEHCSIMRRLALKAVDTRFLNHFERLALLYVFGHLGEEGVRFLHKIISNTMDYNKKTTDYFIGKLPERPIGCIKLKEELRYLGSDSCNCRFKVPKGCYFSPVLHAISIDTFGNGDRNITLPISQESKKDRIVEFFSINQRLEEKIAEVMEIKNKIKELENQKEGCKAEIKRIINNTDKKNMSVPMGMAKINETDGEVEIILKI